MVSLLDPMWIRSFPQNAPLNTCFPVSTHKTNSILHPPPKKWPQLKLLHPQLSHQIFKPLLFKQSQYTPNLTGNSHESSKHSPFKKSQARCKKHTKHRKMENRQPKNSQARCKKHPKHRQSPGVCSVCLTERLSQLSTSASRTKTAFSVASSSSSLSSLSSHYSSFEQSPIRQRHCLAFKKRRSVSFFWSGLKIMLTKSRSMAAVRTTERGGLWSKLARRSMRVAL